MNKTETNAQTVEGAPLIRRRAGDFVRRTVTVRRNIDERVVAAADRQETTYSALVEEALRGIYDAHEVA